jgi:hypothetical protein
MSKCYIQFGSTYFSDYHETWSYTYCNAEYLIFAGNTACHNLASALWHSAVRCYWRFKFSGLRHCVTGREVSEVLKGYGTFVFRVKQSKKKVFEEAERFLIQTSSLTWSYVKTLYFLQWKGCVILNIIITWHSVISMPTVYGAQLRNLIFCLKTMNIFNYEKGINNFKLILLHN